MAPKTKIQKQVDKSHRKKGCYISRELEVTNEIINLEEGEVVTIEDETGYWTEEDLREFEETEKRLIIEEDLREFEETEKKLITDVLHWHKGSASNFRAVYCILELQELLPGDKKIKEKD